MEVRLQNLGKKFSSRWVFRDLNEKIPSGGKCALVGFNGSGKSTLLQIISGARVPTKGSVSYFRNGLSVPFDQVFKYMSFAAPYSDLIEELTLPEFYRFHGRFKAMLQGIDYPAFKEILAYSFRDDQALKSFSSGMKQRIKLAVAFLSENALILLDEPCSNLDSQGRAWYRHLIDQYAGNRTLVIASNDPYEYEMADQDISLDPSS